MLSETQRGGVQLGTQGSLKTTVPVTTGLALCSGERSEAKGEVSGDKLIPAAQSEFRFYAAQAFSAITSV